MVTDNLARAVLATGPGRERVHVLHELKTLLDSFPPRVRQQLLAHIQSVLVGLTR